MYQNRRRLSVKRSLEIDSFTNYYDYGHHRHIQRKRWIGTSSKLLIIGVYYYSLQLGLLSLVLLVVDANTPFVVSKHHVSQKPSSPRSFTSFCAGFITTPSCRGSSSNNISRHRQQFKKKFQTNGLHSIGLSTTSRVVQCNETSTNSSSSPSASSSRRIGQSAFGKAAIGKKNQNNRIINTEFETLPSLSFPPFPPQQDDDGTEQVGIKQTNNGDDGNDNDDDDRIKILPQDPKSKLRRRDEALVALKAHLHLPLKTSIDILNAHPRLYTHLPSLHSKLLYLKNDINLKPKQLTKMLTSHPRLFEAVLLDSEDNIASTMNVLQTELDLTPDDIRTIQSQSLPAILTYPRSELRKRILVYKLDLLYPKDQLQKLIWKDARILRTDSQNVRQVLRVLNEELGMERSDVHSMLRKEILLLTYKADENILPTILYLKRGSIGRCLGMVERKGVSTLLVDSSSSSSINECEDIIKARLKRLILGHPKILSSSVEKNLKLTVSFFLDEVGLTEYEFGRVIYRRGGSLLEANVERTLRRKVEFLREKLGLELQLPEDASGVHDGANDSSNMSIPVPSSKRTKPLSNHDKRRLLAQMIATNPDILTLSIENNLLPKFEYFATATSDTDTENTAMNGIGFSLEQLQHVLLKRPQLLSLSLERNIIPKIECFTKPRIVNDNDNDGKKECGLGMKMQDVRDWIAEYPQMLTYVLDSRIKPRVKDVVDLGLAVCEDDETDDGVPLNFLIRTDRSWSSWLDDHKLRESAGD